ncbi:DUF11 domain-containing protein [Candidatus Saccharibacteria bacterium]|nr:DUF11 domain-containing protein [Candidatus Saccharibacteria bacterium]
MNKKIIKSSLILAGLVASTAVLGANVSALDQTWGPQDRERFTWDKPADYVTFNSITDNPFIGDESNFVRVKEYVEGGANGGWTDNVTVEPGKEYEVFIYFHNNASATLNNDNGEGLALNTRVATSFPTKLKAGDSGVIRGSVSASNADPTKVWDTAFFKADQTIYLSYIPNTAILHSSDNCKTTDGTVLSADAFFASDEDVQKQTDTVGAMIACYNADNLWGTIPGCNEYAGYVTYRVRADQPAFWTEKTVSASGQNNYVEYMDANAGDTLDFKIYYKNTGTTNQIDVVAHDTVQSGLSYVSGTVKVTTPAGTVTLTAEQEAKLFNGSDTNGLIIGDFQPGEEATITYQAKVADTEQLSCGDNILYNDATIQTANGSEFDKVQVTVNKTCAQPTSNTPSELPTTGPTEIALLVVVILTIGGGGFYFYRSAKMLKKVSAGEAPTDFNSESSKTVIEGIRNDTEK